MVCIFIEERKKGDEGVNTLSFPNTGESPVVASSLCVASVAWGFQEAHKPPGASTHRWHTIAAAP